MSFREYIINYNSQFEQDGTKMIDLKNVDLSEDELVSKYMDFYIEMVKEKIQRKQVARKQETFEMSGMSEEEKYLFDSLAGTYIYENQFKRKELREDIAELTGLSISQIDAIAYSNIGAIEELTKEEQREIAKYISTKEEQEPTV